LKNKISIIGLGYVGLPLAIEFSKKYPTVGFDISLNRITDLNNYIDDTFEVDSIDLKDNIVSSEFEFETNNRGLFVSNQSSMIKDSNIYIITVPTPVDNNNQPLLMPIISATQTVGNYLKKGDLVIYESTVYPGLTEEICVPELEKTSKLIYNEDFFIGYSPERINPGDKQRTLTKIIKVTSGSNFETGKKVDDLYKSIITAGTYLAPSIKIAEAAKVIENSQRDINIAFMNELAKIFNLLEIDTNEVLKAAGTKWNFLDFKPGLVGGHCIGVDPYYLTHKAKDMGYNPEIILSGRKLNDLMGNYVAEQVINLMKKNSIEIIDSNVLILGITFKENCPDIRNSKAIDVVKRFNDFECNVTVLDPWANKLEVKKEYDLDIINKIPNNKFDAIVLTVSHNEFSIINLETLKKEKSVVYDVKGILGNKADARL
jgi:UDP-N-acetyl-D-glucosamine/UDP-N-acetyl-D-galactosamine dehydrogenase